VLNLAITGYGPNQYAAVVEQFTPVYHPDLILIGFFVNEYQDVLWTNEQFQQSIGFGQPAPDGWYSVLRLSHLQSFVRLQVAEPLLESLRGRPRPQGYFLGNFTALERDRTDVNGTGRQLVAERLAQIKSAANGAGAKVAILMIPAPVQVCEPDQLAYYPSHVDLGDATQYDLDQPQRITQELAEQLGLGFYDLRPILRSVTTGCPYQPRNMHWTVAGHQAVAAYLAHILGTDGYLKES
jgi:hypothetical protein